MPPLPNPPLHRHRRRLARFPTFMALGSLTLLALCLFAVHLHQLPALPPLGPASSELQAAGVASSSSSSSPSLPDRTNEDFLETLLAIAAQERDRQAAHLPMEYAANKRPTFRDDPPRMVDDLPAEHVPRAAPPSPPPTSPSEPSKGGGRHGGNKHKNPAAPAAGRRLVIVGDVHGHLETLQALLRRIGFDSRQGDHLVLAGDIVTKGPDSRGVVQLAMDLGASAVRGNQDDRVLAAAREMRRLGLDEKGEREDDAEHDDNDDNDDDENEDEDEDDERLDVDARRRVHLRKVARSLSRAQLAWLRSRPLILRIGPLPDASAAPWNASTIAVVHAGLVPGVPLEKQDPWAVMNMRSLVYPREAKHWKLDGALSKGNDGVEEREGEEQEDDDDDNNNNNDDDKHTSDASSDASSIDTSIAIPVDDRKGEPWSHAWNRHQNNLPPAAPRTVVIYGHDARAGVQVDAEVTISPYRPRRKRKRKHAHARDELERKTTRDEKKKRAGKKDKSKGRLADHVGADADADADSTLARSAGGKDARKGVRYAFGLDSGCGQGKQLTALILEADPSGSGIRHRVEQVDCVVRGKKGKGKMHDLR
ncbi:hypothetical protein VTJ83DRAFT_1765 [Remersonia thermophila]|uniref:Calcineurin-like phosphoesterase domain-containing protein n=1 Tax=Remersonia thermophila TaxID=72144 RepID=A0ABR4DGU9_9PEZI